MRNHARLAMLLHYLYFYFINFKTCKLSLTSEKLIKFLSKRRPIHNFYINFILELNYATEKMLEAGKKLLCVQQAYTAKTAEQNQRLPSARIRNR